MSIHTRNSPQVGESRLSSRSQPVETDQGSASVTILQGVLALVFAAVAFSLFSYMGFAVRTSTTCPVAEGYSSCAIWQDCRSIMSFAMGALFCCILTRSTEDEDDSITSSGTTEKVQLYAYML